MRRPQYEILPRSAQLKPTAVLGSHLSGLKFMAMPLMQ